MVQLGCRGWSSGPCICASFCHSALLSENTQHVHSKHNNTAKVTGQTGKGWVPEISAKALVCRATTQGQLHPFHPHLRRADLLAENKTLPSHGESTGLQAALVAHSGCWGSGEGHNFCVRQSSPGGILEPVSSLISPPWSVLASYFHWVCQEGLNLCWHWLQRPWQCQENAQEARPLHADLPRDMTLLACFWKNNIPTASEAGMWLSGGAGRVYT